MQGIEQCNQVVSSDTTPLAVGIVMKLNTRAKDAG